MLHDLSIAVSSATPTTCFFNTIIFLSRLLLLAQMA
jgi:hypothetical protein